jgi:hypothetical protein
MSNRDDFDFEDDPFADDDSFDSFDDDFDQDNLRTFDTLDTEDDLDAFLEEEETSGGPNRAFILLAVLMILVLVIGLGVILYLANRERPPSPDSLTRTAIAVSNATRAVQLSGTQTQAVEFQIETQTEAARPTETPTTSPTASITPSPTEDPAVIQQTSDAATAAIQTVQVVGDSPLMILQTVQADNLATALAVGTEIANQADIADDLRTQIYGTAIAQGVPEGRPGNLDVVTAVAATIEAQGTPIPFVPDDQLRTAVVGTASALGIAVGPINQAEIITAVAGTLEAQGTPIPFVPDEAVRTAIAETAIAAGIPFGPLNFDEIATVVAGTAVAQETPVEELPDDPFGTAVAGTAIVLGYQATIDALELTAAATPEVIVVDSNTILTEVAGTAVAQGTLLADLPDDAYRTAVAATAAAIPVDPPVIIIDQVSTGVAGTAVAQGTLVADLPDAGFSTAVYGTATALGALEVADLPTVTIVGRLNATDVLLTATALSLTLNPQTPSGSETALPGVTPTISGFPTPGPTPPGGGELPDTGLFDGFGGGLGAGTLVLMAVGLVGVIIIARRMRK